MSKHNLALGHATSPKEDEGFGIVESWLPKGSGVLDFSGLLHDVHAASGATASISAQAFQAGYNPSTATGQWNIPTIFGSGSQALLSQYNGQGVHVGVYDSGIDKTNLALMTHYDASRELVINGVKADPGMLGGAGDGIHGTSVNGIIGADAARTSGQVTGLAYGAFLTDVNIFNGAASGAGMLAAIKGMAGFDVTNNSWGWSSKWADFADVPGSFGSQLIANLKFAADTGRGGLGTVIVKAAGNDWLTDHRDANTQEFNADRHAVVVGAIGQDGHVAYYSQRGASVLVSEASNGGGAGITTTDMTGAKGYSAGDITNGFGGTSAAAPEVTAVVADMMSANGKLGWRDVQNILALSAHDTETAKFQTAPTATMAYGWTVNKANTVNGGGFHFSNDEGFGELNGHDAIREAEVWNFFTPTPQTSANEAHLVATAAGQAVSTAAAGTSFSFTLAAGVNIENVDLTLNVTTANMDHLKVLLTGPSGTQSIMLDTSTTTAGETGNVVTKHAWTTGSHAFEGEISGGTWKATVIDTTAADKTVVNGATLDVYGSASTANNHVFHYTDEALFMSAADPSRLVLHDKGATGDWIDTAMMTGAANIDLRTGATSTVGGKAFLTIGTDTTVNKVTLGDGADTVTANNNGDTIVGGHGTHVMNGGTGNDVLIGGWNGGTMTGGAGADTFTFSHLNFGKETITDFAHGVDHIDLRGLGDSFASIKIVETAASTVISNLTASAGDTLTLLNMHGTHLTASDFLFA